MSAARLSGFDRQAVRELVLHEGLRAGDRRRLKIDVDVAVLLVPILSTSSDGAASFADTTRSWRARKIQRGDERRGSAGSGAAIASIFAASSACVERLRDGGRLGFLRRGRHGARRRERERGRLQQRKRALTDREVATWRALWCRYGRASSTTATLAASIEGEFQPMKSDSLLPPGGGARDVAEPRRPPGRP